MRKLSAPIFHISTTFFFIAITCRCSNSRLRASNKFVFFFELLRFIPLFLGNIHKIYFVTYVLHCGTEYWEILLNQIAKRAIEMAAKKALRSNNTCFNCSSSTHIWYTYCRSYVLRTFTVKWNKKRNSHLQITHLQRQSSYVPMRQTCYSQRSRSFHREIDPRNVQAVVSRLGIKRACLLVETKKKSKHIFHLSLKYIFGFHQSWSWTYIYIILYTFALNILIIFYFLDWFSL